MINSIDILTELVFILLHLFLFLFNYIQWNKKLFHPAVLFSLVWAGILALHLISKFTVLDKLESLHSSSFFIFFVGNLFFTAGCYLANLIYKGGFKSKAVAMHAQSLPNLRFRQITTIIILLGLPFYIRAAFEIFLTSNIKNFFTGLRYELSYGNADIGPLKYLMPLAYVVFAFNLYSFYNEKNSTNRLLLIVTLLLLIIYAVFATGRTYFLMILVIYAGISFFVNPRFSVKKFITAFAVFFLIFIGIGILYGKGTNTEESLNENVKSSSENAGIYLVTSLNAFDQDISRHPAGFAEGDNTIRFFIKLGMQLNIIPPRKVNDLFDEFVFVPYPTNVYTYYSPYVRDFGSLYAWLMLAVFGAIHTLLYNNALYQKNQKSLFYYSFLLFPLLLSFFGDQYMSIFSFWLQMIFFTELMFLSNRLFIAKKW